MAFHAYILRCSDGSYYVDHTEDLEKRLSEHRIGGSSCIRESDAPSP